MVQSLQPWKPLNMTIKGQNPTILWYGTSLCYVATLCTQKRIFYRIIRLYGKKKNQHVNMDTAIQYFEGSQLMMMLCVMYLGLARNVSD